MTRSYRSTKSLIHLAGTLGEDHADPTWLGDERGRVSELSARVTELSTLMGVSSLLSSPCTLSEALDSVCRLVGEICKSRVAFIHLADGEDDLVCVARSGSAASLQYAWEGIARIYGRKALQKGLMTSCSNLLVRGRVDQESDDEPRIGALCAVPLQGRSKRVGAMSIGYPGIHRFSAREKDVLNAIAAQVAMAVERSWLFDQLQEQLARANSLREVANHLASNLELDEVLDSIVNHASMLLAADFSAIFLVDGSSRKVSRIQGRGVTRERAHGWPVELDEGPLGRAARQAADTAKPAIVQSILARSPLKPVDEVKPSDYRAALAVPLLSSGEVVGVLAICYLERRRFDPSDVALAEDFARQAALAIRNAWLYGEAMEDRLSLEAAINQINNHGISLLDEDLNIKFANPATFWLLGLSPRQRQMPLHEWTALLKKGLARGSDLDEVIVQIHDNPEAPAVAKLESRDITGLPRTLKLLSLPLRLADGTLKGRVNVLEETSAQD